MATYKFGDMVIVETDKIGVVIEVEQNGEYRVFVKEKHNIWQYTEEEVEPYTEG